MKDHLEQNSNTQNISASESDKAMAGSISNSQRRRVIKSGLAAAPVLLTFASRPVLGTGGNCIAPSQTLSGALSHPQQKLGSCNGKSPGYWKQGWSWPISTSTKFHSVFMMGSQTGRNKFVKLVQNSNGTSSEVSLSFLEVLNLTSNADSEKMGFHVSGAYLNIVDGRIDTKALSINALKAIWNAYATLGYYEPTAGVKWYANEIKAYFLNNNISP